MVSLSCSVRVEGWLPFLFNVLSGSCWILHFVKEKFLRSAGSTTNRTISFRFLAVIYDPYNISTLYVQSISIFCYKIMILFICYYNGNKRLNYVKPRLTLGIWCFLKSQAISFQLDFNSCFPFYSDQHFCYLHPIARTSYGTSDTSRNVTGYSNQNTHAQFP